jgi:hypothetical protein
MSDGFDPTPRVHEDDRFLGYARVNVLLAGFGQIAGPRMVVDGLKRDLQTRAVNDFSRQMGPGAEGGGILDDHDEFAITIAVHPGSFDHTTLSPLIEKARELRFLANPSSCYPVLLLDGFHRVMGLQNAFGEEYKQYAMEHDLPLYDTFRKGISKKLKPLTDTQLNRLTEEMKEKGVMLCKVYLLSESGCLLSGRELTEAQRRKRSEILRTS